MNFVSKNNKPIKGKDLIEILRVLEGRKEDQNKRGEDNSWGNYKGKTW